MRSARPGGTGFESLRRIDDGGAMGGDGKVREAEGCPGGFAGLSGPKAGGSPCRGHRGDGGDAVIAGAASGLCRQADAYAEIDPHAHAEIRPHPTPTPSPTPTATPSPTPTATPSPTPTATPTPHAYCSSEYYVSMSGGKDSNDGSSPSTPWQHISKVILAEPNLAPGTTVNFLGGDTWNETLTLNQVHGSAGQPITFTAYGNGDAIIDGKGGAIGSCVSADQAAGSGNNVSYITLEHFECRNTSQFGINFRVENTAMHGIVIADNYIHNTGPGAYAGGGGAYDDGSYRNQLNAEDDTAGASGGDGFQLIDNVVESCGGHNCLQVHYDTGSPIVQGNTVGPGCLHNCIDTKGLVGGQIVNNVATCPGCNSATAAFYTENTYTANETITYAGNVAYDAPIGFQTEAGGSCAGAFAMLDHREIL